MSQKERLDFWRAERERTRHQTEQGGLIPAAEVEQKFAAVFKSLARAVETWPDRCERERGISAETIVLLQQLGDELREQLFQAATATSKQSEPDDGR